MTAIDDAGVEDAVKRLETFSAESESYSVQVRSGPGFAEVDFDPGGAASIARLLLLMMKSQPTLKNGIVDIASLADEGSDALHFNLIRD